MADDAPPAPLIYVSRHETAEVGVSDGGGVGGCRNYESPSQKRRAFFFSGND